MSAEENDRWVERVGWAPRFGTGSFPDDDDDVQDHQTWVETRLDDKFFGGMLSSLPLSDTKPHGIAVRLTPILQIGITIPL